jgi:hypoxanthine phosphoribosyltransferase
MIQDTAVQIRDLRFRKMISAEEIGARVHALAEELNARFKGKEVVVVSVLNGAFMFTADLIRALDFDVECRFLRIQSYHGTKSTGVLKVENPEILQLTEKHVLVVEDIVDSGRTMQFICSSLEAHGAATVTVATFLHKPDAMEVPAPVDYAGFIIDKEFVVGYGLDYHGMGRQLPDLYQRIND